MAVKMRASLTIVAAIAGFATAALIGVAGAKTFTLHAAADGNVVDAHGFAVYRLSGDSRRHPECTKKNGCFAIWRPLTVASSKRPSKGAGVKGKLGVWHRNGFAQVTLGGHPLYRFVRDTHRGVATGDGIRSFGGTWHVIRAAGSTGSPTTTMTTQTTTQPTTSTTPPPCAYPPYC
jgi:predicted lipoprotein with Yx(FWY)xxD motif